MFSRRDFLQSGRGSRRALAQQRLTQAGAFLLRTARQCHAAARHRPARATDAGLFPRAVEQSRRRRRQGPGAAPHRRAAYLERFGIPEKSAAAYALSAEDFAALAQSLRPHRRARPHGHRREGGARAERGDNVLLLDGGDTWQGSLGANRTKGQDMADCFALLKPDAMTGHWEFTYGNERVKELGATASAFRSSR